MTNEPTSTSSDYGEIESPHEESITRVTVPELDTVLGKRLDVLDDGFIRVVDYMGGDESIVQAARVSYGKGTRKVHEDRGLIRYLMRHRHTTPFEMCDIKFHVRVPMDAWRQWIRHRTASVNEYSTRYSLAIDSAQKTPEDKWRVQSKGNRQGSEGYAGPELGQRMTSREAELQNLSREVYNERIEHGLAREQARKDLPLSTYTEAYWKMNLWNLLHFVSLRMEAHAQEEIRDYAAVIGHEVLARWVPLTWQAFLDYNFNAMHLSALESQLLKHVIAGDIDAASEVASSYGWLNWHEEKGRWKRNRERQEFEERLRNSFGFEIEWKRPQG